MGAAQWQKMSSQVTSLPKTLLAISNLKMSALSLIITNYRKRWIIRLGYLVKSTIIVFPKSEIEIPNSEIKKSFPDHLKMPYSCFFKFRPGFLEIKLLI